MRNKSVQVAVEMDDGSLAVVAFFTEGASPTLPVGAQWISAKAGLWMRAPTSENIQAELTKAFPVVDQLGMPKSQPVLFRIVTETDIPSDRSYRNAWVVKDGKIDHDIDKAKEIHRDKLRKQRSVLFPELDAQWMRAIGQTGAFAGPVPGEAAAIEAERQRLRDAPADPRIEAAKTVEELKTITI